MSNYSAPDPAATDIVALPPGGFRYDPSTLTWSKFGLDTDYRWGDRSNTYSLFNWPGNSVLHQVNIASSNNGTINLGMLYKDDDGTSFNNCTVSSTVLGYANNTVYVVCQAKVDTRFEGPYSLVFPIEDNNTGNLSVGAAVQSSFSVTPSSMFQVLTGGNIVHPWGYDPRFHQQHLLLERENFGISSTLETMVNITESYGELDNSFVDLPSNTGIYIAIGGIVILILLVVFYLRSHWGKITRGRLKRTLKSKIIEIVSKLDDDDAKNTNRGESIINDGDDDSHVKIEDVPIQLVDLNDDGKILVTPDMDLSDIEIDTSMTAGNSTNIDVDAGYIQSANLGSHPRPTITTSISLGLADEGSALNEIPNSSSSAPHLYPPSETTLPYSSDEIDTKIHQIALESPLPNDQMTSHILPTGHLRQLASPSAPPLDTISPGPIDRSDTSSTRSPEVQNRS
ncbi:hypothetical protein BGZ76_000899 [Entomortierella beljakovae]|nr:hypothetical protein BGZ76_000899 [Entomortierella beljakovae]